MIPDNVLLALQRVTHRSLRLVEATARELGVTPVEFNVLANLHALGSSSASSLAAASGLKASTLTGVLDRLEAKSLIERRQNVRDRRSVAIAPTTAGAEASAAAFARVTEVDALIRSILAPSAIRGFSRVIEGLAHLEAPEPEKKS